MNAGSKQKIKDLSKYQKIQPKLLLTWLNIHKELNIIILYLMKNTPHKLSVNTALYQLTKNSTVIEVIQYLM